MMISYRPAVYTFRLSQAPASPPLPPSGASTVDVINTGRNVALTALGLVWTGAAAWVGLRTATREKGWLSAAGWIGGIGALLAAATILAAPLSGQRVITPVDLILKS